MYMFKQQEILGTFQVLMGASGFVSEERINPYRKAMFGNLFDMIKLSCCYHQQLDLFWQLKQSNSLFGCEVFVELCIHIRLFPKIFAHLKVCVYFRINVFVSQSVLIFSILFCPCSFSTFFFFSPWNLHHLSLDGFPSINNDFKQNSEITSSKKNFIYKHFGYLFNF